MSFIFQRFIRFTAQQISALVAGVVGQKADGTLIGIDGLPISTGGLSFTAAQNTAGAANVIAEAAGGVVLNGAGETVLTKSGTATTFPGVLGIGAGSTVGTQSGPALIFGTTTNCGFYRDSNIGTNYLGFSAGGTASFRFTQAEINLVSNGLITWGNQVNSFNASSTTLALRQAGPGILQQRNGTAAQRSQIFNTGDTTNGEWFDIDWQTTANVATIGARAAGTGTLRPVTAVGAWTFSGNQRLTPLVNSQSTLRIDIAGGNAVWNLGSFALDPNYGGMWAGNITPSNANYCFLSNGTSETVFNAPSGGTMILRVGNSATSQLSLTAAGAFLQFPVASLTLASNGQFGVEVTSNTAGNLVYRGSDGTTRRMALVFA